MRHRYVYIYIYSREKGGRCSIEKEDVSSRGRTGEGELWKIGERETKVCGVQQCGSNGEEVRSSLMGTMGCRTSV